MNTKHTLLKNILATESIRQIITRIDFNHLEEYVINELSLFVEQRGCDRVRYDLTYDVQTPTDAFISELLEHGSVKLFRENRQLQNEGFIDALYVIISAINIVIAHFLRERNIVDVSSYRYFDADPQYIFLERAVEHLHYSGNAGQWCFDALSSGLWNPGYATAAC